MASYKLRYLQFLSKVCFWPWCNKWFGKTIYPNPNSAYGLDLEFDLDGVKVNQHIKYPKVKSHSIQKSLSDHIYTQHNQPTKCFIWNTKAVSDNAQHGTKHTICGLEQASAARTSLTTA